MKNKIKLSIIISAFNVDKYIEKCINSCFQQSLDTHSFEVLVIDEGSTDKTVELSNQFNNSHNNFRIIIQLNSGLGSTRNSGIENAKGTYLWFLDGDDYLEKEILNEILLKIEKNDLDVLALNYKIVDNNYKILDEKTSIFKIDREYVSGPEFYRDNYELNYTWLFIFKKDIFIKNSLKFEEKINMQDSEIFPKIMKFTSKVSVMDKHCYYYVQHDNSYTNIKNPEKRFNYFKSLVIVKKSLENTLCNCDDKDLKIGLEKKLDILHKIVFNHLVFNHFDNRWFKESILLLNKNNLYPIKFKPKYKLLPILWGLNSFPYLTKFIIDNILLREK